MCQYINVKPYLAKCLDSLLSQTYPNMEVIVVDDASTDGGGAVCDAFAAKDSRLRVLHLTANSGLSAARNQGVQAAGGQFAAFVDSDDYVESGLLEKLHAQLVETGADVSVCGAAGLKVKEGPAAVYTAEETVGCLARRGPFLWTAWGKLYPMELVKAIPFDRQALCCEDLLFFSQVLQRAGRVCYLPEPLYHYVFREDSIINQPIDEKRCTVLAVLDHICENAALHFPGMEAGFRQVALDTAARLAMQAVEAGAAGGRGDYLKRFRDHTRRHFSHKALSLCPDRKSMAAELALFMGIPAFWCLAAVYRVVKKRKGLGGME